MSDFVSLVVQTNERVSHLEALLAFAVLVPLPLSAIGEEEVVGRTPDLATRLKGDDYLAAHCAGHHFGHPVLLELLGLLVVGNDLCAFL